MKISELLAESTTPPQIEVGDTQSSKPSIVAPLDQEEPLLEGATSILYHKTSVPAALEILQSGEFKMSSSIGNDVEASMAIKGHPYYLSTSRSKTGDYHRYVGDSAVMFVIDGDRVGNSYRVKPVDYWERMWLNNPERTRESEDRIYGKTNTMPTDSVTAVHVLLKQQNDIRSEGVRQLLIAAKTSGIKAYLYTDEKSWRLQDTRKSLSASEFKNVLSGHREDPSYMKRPLRGLGKSKYGRSSILDWIELVKKQPGQELSKGADKIRYNLRYYGDATSQLKNDFFNAKRPGENEYPLVVKLGDYMNKNNLDFRALADRLKQKWAGSK